MKVVEEKQRELPRSGNNVMVEVREFLRHLEAERVVCEGEEGEEGVRVRSAEDLRSIQEGALMAAEERVAIIQRNIEDR